MHFRLIPIIALLGLTLTACQKELPKQVDPAEDQQAIIDAVEMEVQQALNEGLELQLRSTNPIPADAVELPAGSVDGLAAAIAQAGAGGTVLVKAGEHLERSTVTIWEKVAIIGEEGAVIISSSRGMETIGVVEPLLHVNGASGVMIHGLEMRADSDHGGTGILLQNAPRAMVSENTLENFGIGIANHYGDHSFIYRNKVVGSSAWLSDPAISVLGIVNINGQRVRLFNNETSNAVFGLWACDEKGLASGNIGHSNFIGLIVCKVPPALPLPDGSVAGSDRPGGDWILHHNETNGNFHVGIIAIDGANDNLFVMNRAANNADADIELAGDSERFGFLTPTSVNNRVISGPNISIKDCGVNNKVTGGDLIDTALNPCF